MIRKFGTKKNVDLHLNSAHNDSALHPQSQRKSSHNEVFEEISKMIKSTFSQMEKQIFINKLPKRLKNEKRVHSKRNIQDHHKKIKKQRENPIYMNSYKKRMIEMKKNEEQKKKLGLTIGIRKKKSKKAFGTDKTNLKEQNMKSENLTCDSLKEIENEKNKIEKVEKIELKIDIFESQVETDYDETQNSINFDIFTFNNKKNETLNDKNLVPLNSVEKQFDNYFKLKLMDQISNKKLKFKIESFLKREKKNLDFIVGKKKKSNKHIKKEKFIEQKYIDFNSLKMKIYNDVLDKKIMTIPKSFLKFNENKVKKCFISNNVIEEKVCFGIYQNMHDKFFKNIIMKDMSVKKINQNIDFSVLISRIRLKKTKLPIFKKLMLGK